MFWLVLTIIFLWIAATVSKLVLVLILYWNYWHYFIWETIFEGLHILHWMVWRSWEFSFKERLVAQHLALNPVWHYSLHSESARSERNVTRGMLCGMNRLFTTNVTSERSFLIAYNTTGLKHAGFSYRLRQTRLETITTTDSTAALALFHVKLIFHLTMSLIRCWSKQAGLWVNELFDLQILKIE